MNGWGRSATWTTLREAIEAAQRNQPSRYGCCVSNECGTAPDGHAIEISRAHGKMRGFRFRGGDVVARVMPDGTVRYGR